MFKGITFNKAEEIDAVEETLARCNQAAKRTPDAFSKGLPLERKALGPKT